MTAQDDKFQLLSMLVDELVDWLDNRVEYVLYDTIPEALVYIRTVLRAEMFKQHRSRLGQLTVREYKFMNEMFDNVVRVFIKTRFSKRWVVISKLYQ